MEVGNINELPDEVLLEIFIYFPGKTLKLLMSVCKRWWEIISTHASTMKKLPLDLRKLLACSERSVFHHYNTLNIEHINIFDNDLQEYLLTRLGNSVQVLNISYCLINAKHLINLLKNFAHLSHLTITKSKMSEETVSFAAKDANKQEIRLKKLKIIHINYGILKYLDNIQVSVLEIIDANNYKINHENLIEFVLRQRSLKSLIVEEMNNNINSIFLTNDLCFSGTFKLEKFSGLFCTNLARHEFFNDNFISFLRMHTKSLKTLKLSGTSLSPDTYKFAITNFSKLSTLEINPSSIPQENSFYKGLASNSHLKTLNIQSTITRENFNGFVHLLHHYPNICNLTLLDTDEIIGNDLYCIISKELKYLSSLSVLNFNRNFKSSAKIHSLKEFSIKILNDIEQFIEFLSINDTLEKVDVGWIKRDFSEDTIEKIISQPNIKSVKFGGRFIANKRIYDIVSRDYKNLRSLELVVNNYDEVKNFKFVFPLSRDNYIRSKCLYFEESSDREPLND